MALLLGLAALTCGFATTDVLNQPTWTAAGLRRFRFFFSAGAVGAALLYWMGRRYVVLVLLVLIAVATGLAVGPGALLAIAAIQISCAVLGRWLFRESDAALGFLGGLAVWAFAIAVLARVPIHYPAVYWSLLLAVPALRMRDTIGLLVSLRDRVLRRPAFTPSAYVAFSLLALLLAAQWFAAIKPEASTDGLAMHLAIATNMANHHSFTVDFREFLWALMPMGADFCYALGYVAGGEAAARLLNLVMLGCCAYAIYEVASGWVCAPIALLLAATFVSSPLAQLVTGSMLVENFVAALMAGAVLAYRRDNFPLCLFLLGSAVGWKLAAIAMAIVFLPFLIGSWRPARRAWALPALLFLAPASFPYVKAYALSGNPVYPFANSVFRSPYLHEDLYDNRYEEKLTWRTPMQVTFETNRYYEGQNGSFGFQYLLFLPLCVVVAVSGDRFSRSIAITGLIGAALILKIQPNARYLYATLPFLTMAAAAAFSWIDARVAGASLVAMTLLNMHLLPTSNWYHRDFFLRPLFAERGRTEYVQGMAPVREAIEFANRAGGVIVLTQGSSIAEREARFTRITGIIYHFERRWRQRVLLPMCIDCWLKFMRHISCRPTSRTLPS